MNLPPFYIGQKVVRTGRTNQFVTKGDTYTVQECFDCPHCSEWFITISECKTSELTPFRCAFCLCHIKDGVFMGGKAAYFAPIHENFQSISLTKVLETETPLISVQ